MDLIGGNQRSPKQRQSYVREHAPLWRSRCPVFALHDTVVGRRGAETDAVTLIIRPHSRKRAASRNIAFEMIDVRRLEIRTRRLIVAAVFVQPGNRVRIGATVGGHSPFFWARKKSQGKSPSDSSRSGVLQ